MRGLAKFAVAVLAAGFLCGAASASGKPRLLAAEPASEISLKGDFEWTRKKGRNPVSAVLTLLYYLMLIFGGSRE